MKTVHECEQKGIEIERWNRSKMIPANGPALEIKRQSYQRPERPGITAAVEYTLKVEFKGEVHTNKFSDWKPLEKMLISRGYSETRIDWFRRGLIRHKVDGTSYEVISRDPGTHRLK